MKRWRIDNYRDFFNKILKVEEDELIALLENKNNVYSSYKIKKKKGHRTIYYLKDNLDLAKIQGNLIKNFLSNIMLSESCYGFRCNLNYIDFLERHTTLSNDRYFLRLDISNFFESISMELIIDVLSYYIEDSEYVTSDESNKIVYYIKEIVTFDDKLVQGIATSPIISNIVFRQLDIRIEKYCRKLGVEYSRYADDLLFSSEIKSKIHGDFFIGKIAKILSSKSFNLNHKKTIKADKELCINGYVVGKNIRISRKKMQTISRVLFFLNSVNIKKNLNFLDELNHKLKNEMKDNRIYFLNKIQLINYLSGNRAYLISILRYSDEYFGKRIIKKINNIEKLILELDES